MALKFDIPMQTPTTVLDINNFQGLDNKNLNPEIYRAQDMHNFIKINGLHKIRPRITMYWKRYDSDLEIEVGNG